MQDELQQLVAVAGYFEGVLEVDAHLQLLGVIVDAGEDDLGIGLAGFDVVQQGQDCRDVLRNMLCLQ